MKKILITILIVGISIPTSLFAAQTWRYVKFNVTETRGEPTSGCTQMSEFVLLSGGSDVAWPGSTTASNPGGLSSGGEGAASAIDGNTATKLCDLNAVNSTAMTLVIDTTATTVTFDGYKWATANDWDNRDPITWTVEGSNDNSNWTVLDTKTSETITTSRNTYTSNYSIQDQTTSNTPTVQIAGQVNVTGQINIQ